MLINLFIHSFIRIKQERIFRWFYSGTRIAENGLFRTLKTWTKFNNEFCIMTKRNRYKCCRFCLSENAEAHSFYHSFRGNYVWLF